MNDLLLILSEFQEVMAIAKHHLIPKTEKAD